MNCKNCFTPVDGRSAVECSECHASLHKECAINIDGVILCDVCLTVHEEKPVSKFGEFELPDQIRRTYIETYKKCPYKFYLEVIKGHTMPANEYTQVGSDVHEIFEAELEHGIGIEQAKEMMHRRFSKYEDSIFNQGFKSKEEMYQRAMDSIDTFYNLPPLGKIFAIEENIVFNIGDDIPNVSITMDLITERDDGELEMHDWKTGKVMVGQKLSSDLQAPLYIYAVQQQYRKPVKSFEFYYLQENKTRKFIRSEIDPNVYICTVGKREYKVNIIDAIREVKSLFSRIKKGDFNIPQDTRSMHFTCKMCHLKEQGLCEGADEQSWHNLK